MTVVAITPEGLAEMLRTLMIEKGVVSYRELARRTRGSPHGEVSYSSISRASITAAGRLASLAWALGGGEQERGEILARLRTAAGLTARQPPQLRWPAEAQELTPVQVRRVQRIVDTAVALAVGEESGMCQEFDAEFMGTRDLGEVDATEESGGESGSSPAVSAEPASEEVTRPDERPVQNGV